LLLAAWSFRKGRREEAVGLLVSAILTPLAIELLKAAINSPRPHLIPYPTLLRPGSDHGYPSGHALFSMVIFGWGAVLASRHMTRSWERTAAVTACVAFIVGIGFSRLYLGVHWPNDVIGGYLYGLLLVLATAQSRARAEGGGPKKQSGPERQRNHSG
jgi:membrane-associated phospholipid phosphatase